MQVPFPGRARPKHDRGAAAQKRRATDGSRPPLAQCGRPRRVTARVACGRCTSHGAQSQSSWPRPQRRHRRIEILRTEHAICVCPAYSAYPFQRLCENGGPVSGGGLPLPSAPGTLHYRAQQAPAAPGEAMWALPPGPRAAPPALRFSTFRGARAGFWSREAYHLAGPAA